MILGNPPYHGFAGLAVDEECELSEAYRSTKDVRKPEGQGLNDLYVRFFRMAERRIAQETGRGVVCFISNYSWLHGLSFTGMRERYIEAFDAIRVDCLNGDKYKTGKVAPDGSPDPSIFSTEGDPVGIQVGAAYWPTPAGDDQRPRKEFTMTGNLIDVSQLRHVELSITGSLSDDPHTPSKAPFMLISRWKQTN